MSEHTENTIDYDESTGKRTIPELHDLLRPRNVTGWFFGFIERFFFSRDYGALFLASPFVVLAIGGPAFVWWLKESPRTDTVAAYEMAAAEAIDRGDVEAAGIYLSGLVRLRPADKRYRFNQAMHLLQNDEVEDGLKALRPLTTSSPLGYNPARLWLAKQYWAEDPIVEVTAEAQEQALLAILDDSTRDLEASKLLSDYYLQTNQLKAAESRLERIVEYIPALNYTLSVVKVRLGRDPEQYRIYLQAGIQFFQQQLVEDPDNDESRILLAKSHVLANDEEDAFRVLDEGIRNRNSTALRIAMSDMLREFAQKLIVASPANRNKAARRLVQALSYDPASISSVMSLITLDEQRATVPDNAYNSSIQLLREQQARSLGEDVALSRMLSMTGQFDEAITVLDESAHQNDQTEILRSIAIRAAGRPDEADTVLDAMIKRFSEHTDSLTAEEVAYYSNCHIQKREFEAARNVVKDAYPRIKSMYNTDDLTDADKAEASRQTRMMMEALSRACISFYDQLLEDPSFNDADTAMELLAEALATRTNGAFVVDRLAEQVVGEGRFSGKADEFVNRLIASGGETEKIYNMLGLKGLQLGNYERAQMMLERSLSLRAEDPVVLNNLALAIVRNPDTDSKGVNRSLDLANDVLRLLPGNKDALSTRAEVYIRLKRWEDARADLQNALKKDPSDAKIHELLAIVFDALGEPGVAEQHRQIVERLRAEEADRKSNRK